MVAFCTTPILAFDAKHLKLLSACKKTNLNGTKHSEGKDEDVRMTRTDRRAQGFVSLLSPKIVISSFQGLDPDTAAPMILYEPKQFNLGKRTPFRQ